ncbi:MAG: haloacid dehalogenase-like hydrolase [Aerococcus sp.]|nr:haloacid dehalogenase-like hydrolase [Aerococcus sp.]
MVKRLISANASDLLAMSPQELKQSIKASEGRVVVSENVVISPSWIPDITNSEMARAFGADLILLNAFDVSRPAIQGLEDTSNAIIQTLKRLVGRPIGVNLEPVDQLAEMASDRLAINVGRQATKASYQRANVLGFDFICLTGNPGTGVTNDQLLEALSVAKETFQGLIIAGKMHGAGVNEPVMTPSVARALIQRGADILLVPAVGTVPGFDSEQLRGIVTEAHQHGALVMSAIGSSQESARPELIQQMAIQNKIAGVDLQHIGDAGYSGLAPAENIMALSEAIRGKRHTYSMMARSILR